MTSGRPFKDGITSAWQVLDLLRKTVFDGPRLKTAQVSSGPAVFKMVHMALEYVPSACKNG